MQSGAAINSVDELGDTALHYASRNFCVNSAQLLIQHGALVNVRNKIGRTPLIMASMNGCEEIVRLLLAVDAHVQAKDTWGESALHVAAINGHQQVTRLLLEYEHDVDHSAADNEGVTPLMKAVIHNELIIARLLRDRGAYVDKQDNQGYSALHYAADTGQAELVELLLRSNVDMELTTFEHGYTPLMCAALLNNKPMVELLLLYGASIDAKDKNNMTALEHAVQEDNSQIVHLLLSQSAALNRQQNKNEVVH